MQVTIMNVDVQVGKPGPKGWSKAVVSYVFNGQQRKQNVMSFSNPQVYAAVTSGELTGQVVEVDITKNTQGYDEWAKVSPSNGATQSGASVGSQTSPVATTATRVTGSNYETKEERARRQVLIVKQSSLTAALKFMELDEGDGTGFSKQDIKDLAQEFADWVMEEPNLEEDNV